MEEENLTIKEFFKRWKQGIENITPYQQAKINLVGVIIMIIGVIWGLIATLISKSYWLFTILVGSFILISINLIASLQKYFALKKINEHLMEVKDEQESTI